MSTTTTQNDAPDPGRFAGLSMADAIALVIEEGKAEEAAEAEALADDDYDPDAYRFGPRGDR